MLGIPRRVRLLAMVRARPALGSVLMIGGMRGIHRVRIFLLPAHRGKAVGSVVVVLGGLVMHISVARLARVGGFEFMTSKYDRTLGFINECSATKQA